MEDREDNDTISARIWFDDQDPLNMGYTYRTKNDCGETIEENSIGSIGELDALLRLVDLVGVEECGAMLPTSSPRIADELAPVREWLLS